MPQFGNNNGLKIQIEVPVFLLFFGFILSESVTTNLVIFRTCYVTLGYNKSECALLGTSYSDNATEQLEKLVQPTASVISMIQSLITAFSSMILCFFVGPWSDRFGRKPILIIPVLGFAASYVVMIIYSILPNLSPWYITVAAIPPMLTGGGSCYLTVLFSYITDVTSDSNRGLKMGIFEAVMSTGIFMGNILSSYVFRALNYYGVYIISGTCCLLGAVYTAIFIPESLQNPETQGGFRELFKLSNLSDMLKCAFKKRENYDRCIMLSTIVILCVFILIVNGDSAVIFLYLREKFDFSLKTYTLYNAAHNLTWVFGTLIGVYGLHKLLKVPETILILIGVISLLNSSLVQGLADQKWEIYAAAFLRAPAGALSPMLRSFVSKIVPSEDIGKVFTLITTSESLIGLIGSPLYTEIYNKTLKVNSAIFSYVSAGFYCISLVIAIFIVVMRTIENRKASYNDFANEETISESSEGEEDRLALIE